MCTTSKSSGDILTLPTSEGDTICGYYIINAEENMSWFVGSQ